MPLDLCGNASPWFTEVTVEAGIRFKHTDGRSGERYFLETLGAGAAWFDYDRDGDVDLYFVNGASLPGAQIDVPPTNVLYRNNGDMTFTDVTVQAKVGDGSYGFGCCVGDFDNDGWQDLYITNFGANILYRNNGDGSFSDVTETAGVGEERWSASAAFADYDKDGDLDLYVANYLDYRLEENTVCHRGDLRVYCPPADFTGAPDTLFENKGDGTFVDVSRKSGVFNPEGKGLGVVWGDYDNDGYPDIFVANDTTADMLYRNNGDGTFMDVALFVGVALGAKGIPMGGMGTSFGDYDNDGGLDIVVTNFQDDPNSLYHGEGDGTFADASYSSRLGGVSLPYVGWGVDFVDLDNDGLVDLFVGNGNIYDNVEKFDPGYTYPQRNLVFRNQGDGTLNEISNRCGPGLELNKVSRGVAFGDYDNDGDIDILVTNSNQTPDLLLNESGSQYNWLGLKLVGTSSNKDAIGARVRLFAPGLEPQLREVKSGSSYLCQSDMRLHFGLGMASSVTRIEIRWPSGLEEAFEGIKPNQFLEIREGEKQVLYFDSRNQ
ncbi:MAG: CRTAC1 family protein [Candidatus Poribacteria bacterium]|nr:CRTAC1 family protein [Candidatus Poribacteria bacterium]